MNDKRLNIRISGKGLSLIRERSKANGISQSKLVTIAIELVTDDDILQYMLSKIEKKYNKK